MNRMNVKSSDKKSFDYMSKVDEVNAKLADGHLLLVDTAGAIDEHRRALEEEINGKKSYGYTLDLLQNLKLKISALYVLADMLDNASKSLDCAWKERFDEK